LAEVKIEGSPEVIDYQNPDNVFIQLTFEAPASDLFIEWFHTLTGHRWDPSLTPEMRTVTANMIQFRTTEAALEEHTKLVIGWIEATNDHIRSKELENQKQLTMQQDRKAERERKRQALQEKLKDVLKS
jgi:hypothetical protein